MAKILIVYDSKTGHTETMAKAIAEGARSVKNINVELRKLGTPFPMTLLDESDAIIFGSPTRYANVTVEMKAFLDATKTLKKEGRLKLGGKIGAAFGSYGWDGGWNLEKLEDEMKSLGIKIEDPIVESVDDPTEKVLKACKELGKNIAEKVAK